MGSSPPPPDSLIPIANLLVEPDHVKLPVCPDFSVDLLPSTVNVKVSTWSDLGVTEYFSVGSPPASPYSAFENLTASLIKATKAGGNRAVPGGVHPREA